MKKELFFGAALAFIGACGNSQQKAINEVQFGLTTASAVGRTAALAMDAMKGMPVACATVKTACSTFPCTTGEVTIALGPGCPLPLGGAATGTTHQGPESSIGNHAADTALALVGSNQTLHSPKAAHAKSAERAPVSSKCAGRYEFRTHAEPFASSSPSCGAAQRPPQTTWQS